MKKSIKLIGFVLLALVLTFVTFRWGKIIETYHFYQSQKPEKRLLYYQDNRPYFSHRDISKSSKPSPLPISDNLVDLPVEFFSLDSMVSTRQYLDILRYEGLLIIKDGEIVYEQYLNGLKENEVHSANSITKSILSLAIGIAIEEGLIGSKDDLVIQYLPQFKNTWYSDVTIDECLDMVSGVKWENDYSMMVDFLLKWKWNLTSAEEFLLRIENLHEPGEKMVYNSMDPLLVGLVLKSVIGKRTISEYIQEKIWDPLGAEHNSHFIVGDENGLEITWMGLNTSLRDLGKIGQLYLEDDVWNGKQLISKSWVDQSFTAHRETTLPRLDKSLRWDIDGTYGWGYNNYWWIPDNSKGYETFAWGAFGQVIYINKLKDLVVVSFRAEDSDGKIKDFNFLDRSMLDFMQAIAKNIK